MRLVAALGVIFYAAAMAFQGLAQQRPGLEPDKIDCAYRVILLRDRVVALTERSPRFFHGDPQDEIVSTLIRETKAACSTSDAHTARRVDLIDRSFRAYRRRRGLDEETRHALLAL